MQMTSSSSDEHVMHVSYVAQTLHKHWFTFSSPVLTLLTVCHLQSSLRSSSLIWASEESLVRTRERAAKPRGAEERRARLFLLSSAPRSRVLVRPTSQAIYKGDGIAVPVLQ